MSPRGKKVQPGLCIHAPAQDEEKVHGFSNQRRGARCVRRLASCQAQDRRRCVEGFVHRCAFPQRIGLIRLIRRRSMDSQRTSGEQMSRIVRRKLRPSRPRQPSPRRTVGCWPFDIGRQTNQQIRTVDHEQTSRRPRAFAQAPPSTSASTTSAQAPEVASAPKMSERPEAVKAAPKRHVKLAPRIVMRFRTQNKLGGLLACPNQRACLIGVGSVSSHGRRSRAGAR
jgi:hypothetical protein